MQRDEIRVYWKEGFSAFGKGLALRKCPYTLYSVEYEAWRNGWKFAEDIKAANDILKDDPFLLGTNMFDWAKKVGEKV